MSERNQTCTHGLGRRGLLAAAGSWICVASALCCHAGMLAYEPFDGVRIGWPIAGMNGGSGFGGAWFDSGDTVNHWLAGEALAYDPLPTQGGRLEVTSVSSPIA